MILIHNVFTSQLKLDIAEMKSLVTSASRTKVKDLLSVEVSSSTLRSSLTNDLLS